VVDFNTSDFQRLVTPFRGIHLEAKDLIRIITTKFHSLLVFEIKDKMQPEKSAQDIILRKTKLFHLHNLVSWFKKNILFSSPANWMHFYTDGSVDSLQRDVKC